MGFWSECDVNWSLSLDGALHTPTEPTSVYGGWGRGTPSSSIPFNCKSWAGSSHVTGNVPCTVKSCEVCLLYKSFLVSFHQSSKFSAICHYVPRGEDFKLEILVTWPKQIKIMQQPLFANWVPFTASEMKMMCWVKHCTGAANNIIFRKWWFGAREATWRWAQLWSCL